MASVIFNVFRKISSLGFGKSRQKEIDPTSPQLNKVENCLMEIQKILIWDDPLLSCYCIISVNFVFWLIIYLDFKFYGIIFMALLILSLEQLSADYIYPLLNKNETNSQNRNPNAKPSPTSTVRILSASEVRSCLKEVNSLIKDFYVKAKHLRQTQPGKFCILTCLCFLLLNFFGRSISGTMSLYILLMLTMTVPGVLLHFIPSYVISSSSNFIYSSHKGETDDNDDEVEAYLPQTNSETLELLKLAADVQLPDKEDDEDTNDLLLERISSRTNEKSELACSKPSFYPESTFMPSPENSMDFLDLDLTPEACPEREKNEIYFQSQHFDGDSSDEEEFVKGLSLTQTASDKPKSENNKANLNQPSLLSTDNLISLGANLLTAVAKQNATKGDRESSSDTDSFEMISEEDM